MLRVLQRAWGPWLICVGMWICALPARAQLGDASSGLPGVVRVGAPAPERTAIALAGSGGYAVTEAQPGEDGVHHRAQGALAAAFTLRDWVGAYLRIDGRYDVHPDDAMGSDTSAVGELRAGVRVGHELSKVVSLGGEVDVWMPGGDAPSFEPSATTVDLRALLGITPTRAWYLGVLGGFRIDQSANSLPDGTLLRPGDMLSLGLSDFHAVLAGLGSSYRIGNTELLAELSADFLVGDGAPSALDSPMRASAGVRQHIGKALQVQGWFDAGLSGRAALEPGGPLIPVEPRFAVQLGLQYAFVIDDGEGRPPPEPAKPKEPPPEPTPVEEPPVVPVVPVATGPASVSGRVLDDNGGELAGARVSYLRESEVREVTTAADGSYSLTDLPAGQASLTLTLTGYKELTQEITLEPGQALALDLTTTADNPLGQIRGTVRSFKGEPLRATVTIYPSKVKVTTDEQGAFEIDVDPGKHTVRLRAHGYASQNRDVEVQQNGVTVLNVELDAK